MKRFVPVLATLGCVALAACTVTTNGGTPPASLDAGGGDSGSSGGNDGGNGIDGGNDGGSGNDGAVGSGGCGFGEPNDSRETATPITLDTPYAGLCVANEDGSDEFDFYEITAPNDAAGGYVLVFITNVSAQGLAEIKVTGSQDSEQVVSAYKTDDGANLRAWFTVSPSAKYRIAVSRFGGGGGGRYTYDLAVRYTKTVDAYEPNNSKMDAKLITKGTAIVASTAANSPRGDLIPADVEDWYKVVLTAGMVSVKVTANPADYECDVTLFDPSGVQVDEKYVTTEGADCILDATATTAGTYLIKQTRFGGVSVRGGEGEVTPTMTGTYSLLVSQ